MKETKNIILLDAPFEIGSLVEPLINEYYDKDDEMFYIVVGYEVLGTNESGEVNSYMIKAQGQGSEVVYFYKDTLRKKEK